MNEPMVAASSDWRTFGADSLPPILAASLTCFVEHGYHGTTTRALAGAAGLSVPGLYHHFASKQTIIAELMQQAMNDLYSRSLAASEEGQTIEERFALQVECLTLFHAHRQELAFIAANEIRSLESAARARHIAARDRQQSLLEVIVAEGTADGIFAVDDVKGVTRAIITMCTGVAQWYLPYAGPLTPEQLAAQYVVIARRIVGLLPRTPASRSFRHSVICEE